MYLASCLWAAGIALAADWPILAGMLTVVGAACQFIDGLLPHPREEERGANDID